MYLGPPASKTLGCSTPKGDQLRKVLLYTFYAHSQVKTLDKTRPKHPAMYMYNMHIRHEQCQDIYKHTPSRTHNIRTLRMLSRSYSINISTHIYTRICVETRKYFTIAETVERDIYKFTIVLSTECTGGEWHVWDYLHRYRIWYKNVR